jgi:hypothetical protein
MGRRVITQRDIDREKLAFKALGKTGAAPSTKDDFVTALLKYIPAEIVGAFVFIDGIVGTTSTDMYVRWAVFAVLLILTPVYIWRVTNEPGKQIAKAQIAVSTVAFAVWVFTIGGPFAQYSWYVSRYAAALLAIYTVAIPAILGISTGTPEPKPNPGKP